MLPFVALAVVLALKVIVGLRVSPLTFTLSVNCVDELILEIVAPIGMRVPLTVWPTTRPVVVPLLSVTVFFLLFTLLMRETDGLSQDASSTPGSAAALAENSGYAARTKWEWGGTRRERKKKSRSQELVSPNHQPHSCGTVSIITL
jgi:hypothetical protein